jgi:DNA (cytosine-5)-methyltransferase 1
MGFDDTRGTLFYDIARIAEYRRPKFLFLENVANFVKHDGGKTLQTILNALNSIDYDVYYDVLNASLFGVPQSRKRAYFLCIRKDLNFKTYAFPTPTLENISLKNIILEDKYVKDLIIERKDVFFDKNIALMNNYKNSQLKPIRIGYVNKGGQGERIYSEYGHAITLSAYGGGVGAKTGLYYINGAVRKLHPEECKRVMTFPENFIVHERVNQAYKQFGNSVVVKMIKIIFEKLLKDNNLAR